MSSVDFDQAVDLSIGDDRFSTPMERLVHLRSVPSLGTLQGDGVMYLAQRSKERRWAKGDRVYHPDQRVDCVHFIVEGSIRVIQEGKRLLDSKAPWAVGFQPVLSDSPIPQLAFALEDTITLEVTRADIFELMETDFGFLAAGIRQNSRQMLEYQRRLEGGGNLQRSEPEEVPYPDETLDLVQRLSLSRFGPYADSNIASLLQLVRIQKEVRLPAGSDLWQLGEDALWGIRIVYGVVACEDPTRKFRMGPGSVLGFLEANGSLPRSYSARTETEFVGLRVDTDQFFDVFEDNYNLAVSFIKFSAGWVLDLSVKLAEADIRESESSDAAQ